MGENGEKGNRDFKNFDPNNIPDNFPKRQNQNQSQSQEEQTTNNEV